MGKFVPALIRGPFARAMRVSLSAIKYIAGTGPAGPAGQPGPTLPALEAGRHCQCWSTRAPALLPGERLVGGIATRKFQAIRSPARVTGVEAIRARSDSQEQDSDSARIAWLIAGPLRPGTVSVACLFNSVGFGRGAQ
jgi:hypothetical protein